MCIVCALWNKGKLTTKEAESALRELIIEKPAPDEHDLEIKEKIKIAKENELKNKEAL